MQFEWDPRKAEANLHVHGIRFAETVTVWDDALALTREDPEAVAEQRFVKLGLSNQATLLVVVYAYREPEHHPNALSVAGQQATEGGL